MRKLLLLGLILFFATGCGSSGGGGSSTGKITISANPATVTGSSYDSGHQRKWNWQMTFSETGGVSVTLNNYTNTISGNNGYHPDPVSGSLPIAVTSHGQQSLNFETQSGSSAEGQPLFTSGTSHWQFSGSDSQDHQITAEITVTFQ